MSYDMYLIDIAKTLSNLGLIYSELMKFEDAERMHLEALKIKKKIAEHYPEQVYPELVLTLIDLGDLYATLNKFEDAEPMFSKALMISKQLADQNPEVYLYNVAIIQNSLGTILTRLQKFEDAEQMYLDALKIFKIYAKEDPKAYNYNVADVQNNIGYLFLNVRNFEKAEYYLNKASKRDPANIEIIYNMACLESLKNNKEKALELLTKVIKFDANYLERALQDKKFDNLKDLKKFKELTSK
jgi:tetratricopeptide (TPR) repeat protein